LCPEETDLNAATVRSLIAWNAIYTPDWDSTPGLYVEQGLAPWGKSRRLGALKLGRLKAYIGVQHIDPSIPGWAIVPEPEARYFVSVLVNNRTTTLRTFPDMEGVLSFLTSVLEPHTN
jgi:hypothetical protein